MFTDYDLATHKKGIYVGSFDPPTNAHLWMIHQGTDLFDTLIIVIGKNPNKDYIFSLEERVSMMKNVVSSMPNAHLLDSLHLYNFDDARRKFVRIFNHPYHYPEIIIDSLENKFLVDYAKEKNVGYVLRGIRNHEDFEYERTMKRVNEGLNPEIIPIYLIPPRELEEVSSSLVKNFIGYKGWEEVVKKYVPETIHRKLIERFGK